MTRDKAKKSSRFPRRGHGSARESLTNSQAAGERLSVGLSKNDKPPIRDPIEKKKSSPNKRKYIVLFSVVSIAICATGWVWAKKYLSKKKQADEQFTLERSPDYLTIPKILTIPQKKETASEFPETPEKEAEPVHTVALSPTESRPALVRPRPQPRSEQSLVRKPLPPPAEPAPLYESHEDSALKGSAPALYRSGKAGMLEPPPVENGRRSWPRVEECRGKGQARVNYQVALSAGRPEQISAMWTACQISE